MTASQYRDACHSLGLTPGYGAAKALGKSIPTVVRYANGTTPIPETIELLLSAYVVIDHLHKSMKV